MTLRGMLLLLAGLAVAAAQSQEPPPADQPGTVPLIRTETRLVLLDTVVTDKKGKYVPDLEAKNFKVWEDNKEQTIKTFTFSADPNSPLSNQTRYLVLFFDNSTMDFGEQAQARKAAAQFIDANTGPNRLVAIANFGGALQITQNFTSDTERLKQLVSGIKTSAVSPNGDPGARRLGGAAGYGARSVLMALRELAKDLSDVPGRKSLIFLTAGFRLNEELQSEVTAAIDMCNRSNVAVYPIDVRGLATMSPGSPTGAPGGGRPRGALLLPSWSPAASLPTASLMMASFQTRGGGAGGAGGGKPPGATGGGQPNPGGGGRQPSSGTGNPGGNNGGGGGGNMNQSGRNVYNLPRSIVPTIPPSTLDNQQVLYMLAEGTGGFVIVNTNDLLGGLEKIGQEQNQYYVLGYTPPESAEGACHTVRIKVDHGYAVRSRTGYCNVKPVDILSGKPAERQLEARVSGTTKGTIAAAMQAPFFYTTADTARVNVAVEIPSPALKFQKVKGKLHAAMDVMGIAYRPNGDVAARFSDTVKFDFEDKKQVETFNAKPLHYENQFDVASGQYTLKLAFTSGEGFGKLEVPLSIDPNDGQKFAISGLALSREYHRVSDQEASLDAALLEGRSPLVAGPFQFTPTGAYQFKTTETPNIYFEVYDPALTGEKMPQVGAMMSIIDRTSGKQEAEFGPISIQPFVKPGNPVVAAGIKLPVSKLKPGAYTLNIKAINSRGSEALRSTDFEVQ